MISVIVPVYNVEQYLDKCIESLVHQTYKDIEIILVDDGSTDRSLEICHRWCQKDERIKVVHKENEGVSSARNIGLNIMKGQYVFFIDADDWIETDCLQDMIDCMSDSVDIVNCDFQVTEEPGCQYNQFSYPQRYGLLLKEDCIADYYHLKLYTQTVWGKLFKKELWDEVRFQKLKYSEDTYAMFEIIEKSRNIYLLDKRYYYYLQRNGGASHYNNASYYEDILWTLDFNYQKALVQYRDYVEKAAQDYIYIAYALLKIYVSDKERKKSFQLIRKMKKIKKEANIQERVRSIQLLSLPAHIIYFLILVKNSMKND